MGRWAWATCKACALGSVPGCTPDGKCTSAALFAAYTLEWQVHNVDNTVHCTPMTPAPVRACLAAEATAAAPPFCLACGWR